jgi:GNAT superfamily N-acetyltransferase
MRVHLATPEDAEAACDVLRRSIVELCESDHSGDQEAIACWLSNKTPETVLDWISDTTNVFLVAIDDQAILSVAAMTRTGCVTLNYVRPESRFARGSKALLATLEGVARRLGLSALTLRSTKTAERFYRTAGFVENTDDAQGDSYSMIKPLSVSA